MRLIVCSFLMIACLSFGSAFAEEVTASYPDPADPFMGDWKGAWTSGEEKEPDLAAQVIALGGGSYEIRLVPALYKRCPPEAVVTATAEEGALRFDDGNFYGSIEGDTFSGGRHGDDPGTFELKRFTWESPTLGAARPAGAVELFNGEDFDAWRRFPRDKTWDILEGGVVQADPDLGYIVSEERFEDCQIHLEFRTPFMPEARGQGRGNSGLFVQWVFEVQILDSYGLPGYWNECGALYKQAGPYVNMCLPPTQWQTYDITFRAARYDDDTLVENARITVVHNGVTIHKDRELPHGTSGRGIGSHAESPDHPDSIRLQAHNNRVQFRNLWVLPLEDARP
jgi:hypothetical protein